MLLLRSLLSIGVNYALISECNFLQSKVNRENARLLINNTQFFVLIWKTDNEGVFRI